ncbi:MAG: glycosyltransferase family 4 protein [Actinomycetota bacterium]
MATSELRGAEMFAGDLVRGLSASTEDQMVAILRGSAGPAAQFDAPWAALGGNGSSLPGLRMHLGALWRLRALVRRWRPDVIQAHGGEPLKYAVSATRAAPRVPVVYRRIGAAPRRLARGAPRAAYGALIRRASRVVAVAEAVRQETVDIFRLSPARVVTIPNGVDPQRMKPTTSREETRRALGIEPNRAVLVSLGALTWEKDPLAHLDVSTRVARERSDVVHLVIGGGPMHQAIQTAIDERGLRGRVLLVGPRKDVPDLLAAGDVLVFASRSDGMEGMPASVIEAGMAGLPVAAYSVAGVSEVVADRETGLLVQPGDVAGLARSATAILGDPALLQRMGAAARSRCSELFDIRRIAPRYLEVYREVAGR